MPIPPSAALVTGASRGLGRALAAELVRHGRTVLVDARHEDALAAAVAPLTGADGSIVPVAGDITDPAHRAELAARAAALGGLDLVVLNAGTLGPSPLPAVDGLSLDELRQTLETNLVAQVGLVQVLLPHLRPGATIVAVTSDAAVEAYPGWGAYAAAKAGLEQLLAVLAVERPDLRVLRVDPGDLRTQMHQDAFPGEDISDRPVPEVVVPALHALIRGPLPSGRYRLSEVSLPQEVA